MNNHLFRFLLGGILIISLLASPALAAPTQAQSASDDPDAPAIEAALQAAIHSKNGEVLAFVLYEISIDRLVYAPDRNSALVWLAMTDPAEGRVIAAEPGLAIADRQGDGWQITLQSDADWAARLEKVPAELLPEELRASFLDEVKDAQAGPAAYTGYKLPWGGGEAKRLSGSIGHFLIYHSCSIDSCRYAYDFADGTMFPLLAARGGTVHMWKDSCQNYDPDCSNYIVIKDGSTTPTTYQLYLHLANETIPPELKSVGALVNQGQFIGNVDDTGYSTDHHLHFHVHTNPYSYWGNSVDVRFDEVDINDGQPRTCQEASNWPQYGDECHEGGNWFVSGNELAKGPSGKLTQPAGSGVTTITERSLTVSGSGTDDRGVIKMQVLARTVDRSWFALGAPQTGNPFTAQIDLCAAGLPDGPITLTLQLWDVEGNTSISSSYRTIYKQHTCQPVPPACQPSASQAALFSGENYGGTCRLYDSGSHVLEGVLNDQVRSLLVGGNVVATLYTNDDYSGRRESWAGDDPNLADNAIGLDTAGSLRISSRSSAPIAAQIISPHNVEGAGLSSTDSVLFTWLGGRGAAEFSAALQGPGGLSREMDWGKAPAWSVGSLPAGSYTLTVKERNPAGETSSQLNFEITAASLPSATPLSLPIDERFEAGSSAWSATGLWRRDDPSLANRDSNTWGFSDGTDYDYGTTRGGSLTSPPIQIPAAGAKMFFEYYQWLGDEQPFWDQRWLQISADNGPFTNFYQFQNDRANAWLISPLLDLSAYAGKTIRLRWFFHSVDGENNGKPGWFIDNLNVLANPPDTSCKDIPANDTPATASAIATYGRSSKLYLCPSGDLDYYTFEAQAGDTLNLWVEAHTLGALTDGVLYLLDSDGSSVLAWNDDMSSGVRDPKINFQFTHDGRYYLRFKDYKHPGYGGYAYYYYLNLYLTSAPPQVTWLVPGSAWLPAKALQLNAQVENPEGQTTKVEFYRHGSDWSDPAWTLLGSDTSSSGGWTLNYTPNPAADQGASYYARAYDRSGQIGGTVRWNTKVDDALPVAAFDPLPAVVQTTYIPLSWTASDSGSGLALLELLWRVNGGPWQNWSPAIKKSTRSAVYLGNPGENLLFQLNAQDAAGNLAQPAAQTGTQIEAVCTPDEYEESGDDVRQNAFKLEVGIWQEHNFCAAADEDWLSFTAAETGDYLILTQSLSGWAAARLEAYSASGTLLRSVPATGYGQNTAMRLEVTQGEGYSLRIRPINSKLLGSQVRYRVYAGPGVWMTLPVIQR